VGFPHVVDSVRQFDSFAIIVSFGKMPVIRPHAAANQITRVTIVKARPLSALVGFFRNGRKLSPSASNHLWILKPNLKHPMPHALISGPQNETRPVRFPNHFTAGNAMNFFAFP
jgi:hypothetical protein